MATTSTALSTVKNKLATRANGETKKPVTVADWLQSDQFKNQMAMVLPKHITPDRLARICLFSIRQNPQLQACNRDSLLASVMQSAQLGLEPGILGHCYMLPFKNTKTNSTDVQFIIGYKGYLELLRRSGEIATISCQIHYDNDIMELSYGMENNLKHIPWFARKDEPQEKPGKVVGAYAVFTFKDGSVYPHYMPLYEILKRKSRSKSASSKYSPWETDQEAMIKKTVIRDAIKWLPLSIEKVDSAVAEDESVRTNINPDMFDEAPVYANDIIDAEFESEPDTPLVNFLRTYQDCFGDNDPVMVLKFACQTLNRDNIASINQLTDKDLQKMLKALEQFRSDSIDVPDDIFSSPAEEIDPETMKAK